MGTAVVTGSASGIGAAVRAQLERDGDRVIGVDIHHTQEMQEGDVVADLSAPEGRRDAIAAVREACGGALDRLVLCAGLGSHVDDLTKVASVNYFGAVDLLDGLRDTLAGRPDAAAVVICSNSAQMARFDEHPFVLALLAGDEARAHEIIADENGFVAYGGSKHAVSRAVRRRAKVWGEAGVRLNGIAPGPTDTPLMDGAKAHPVWGKGVDSLEIPLGRWARADEIAALIAFMLSPAAGYVHGSIWYADGGIDACIRPDRF